MESITEKEIITEKPETPRFFGRNRAAAVFALIAALAASGAAVLEPFIRYEDFFCEYANYYSGLSDRQAGLARAKYCRDSVYSDLCKLGTIYLTECSGGIYNGSRTTYEGLYAGLSQFDESYTSQAENIFGLKNVSSRALRIEQSKYTITSIDSDYYDFYVSYGDECLTNISGFESGGEPSEVISRLTDKYPEWYYLREGGTVRTKTKYDESGLSKTEVYYTAANPDGSPALTSEYIDSDKLIFGACSKDNYGRYIYCFDSSGDRTIPDPESFSQTSELQLDSEGVLHISQEYTDENPDESGVFGTGFVEYTVKPDSPDYHAYLAANGGAIDQNGSWLDLKDMPDYELSPIDMTKLTLFMSPKTDIVAASESFVSKHRSMRRTLGIAQTAALGALGFFGVAALMAMILRQKESYAADGKPAVYRLLKTDSSLIFLAAGALCFLLTVFSVLDGHLGASMDTDDLMASGCFAGFSLLAALLGAGGEVRQLKLHGFREPHEFLAADIWRGTAGARRRTKERFYETALMRALRKLPVDTRQMVYFNTALLSLAVTVLTAAVSYTNGSIPVLTIPAAVLFILSALAYIISTRRLAKDIRKLTAQAEDMLGGEGADIRSAANRLDTISPVYPLGEKLESVSGAAEKAVEERIRSERMKIELVTNVSHDLKTPLTSMIGYIDLLEKTELPDEARDYVSILSRKADKLRDIVSDVFTLAKAVSGVEVELAELDFAVMARQVTADISDKAETSGRELKTDIQPAHAPITADGSKLYRVIQNLLDNALKYSMEGSRIYLTLSEKGACYELEVRNVCGSEPDFTAEEILERFARGDKSRTDGGSGLGLSIAKSFTEACGGSFEIVLDRDIFTAYVRFNKREEKEKETEEDTPE